MKTCFKCHRELPISEFYVHLQMGDGHLGKCKDCTKKDTAARIARKKLDLDWMLKERERCRLKDNRRRWLGLLPPACRDKRTEAQNKYRLRFPERARAHYLVAESVKWGRMNRLPCSVCGDSQSHAHHEDYSRPFDVVWLCPKHHSQRHRQLNKEALKKQFLEMKAAL